VRDYLQSPTLDRALTSGARLELDTCAHEHLRMPRVLLDGVLERDMALLQGRLPRHVEVASCAEVQVLLRDYDRLRLAGGPSTLTACAQLTLAIEAQLRWALMRDCEPSDRQRLQKLGLAAMAEFLSRPLDQLKPLDLAKRP